MRSFNEHQIRAAITPSSPIVTRGPYVGRQAQMIAHPSSMVDQYITFERSPMRIKHVIISQGESERHLEY